MELNDLLDIGDDFNKAKRNAMAASVATIVIAATATVSEPNNLTLKIFSLELKIPLPALLVSAIGFCIYAAYVFYIQHQRAVTMNSAPSLKIKASTTEAALQSLENEFRAMVTDAQRIRKKIGGIEQLESDLLAFQMETTHDDEQLRESMISLEDLKRQMTQLRASNPDDWRWNDDIQRTTDRAIDGVQHVFQNGMRKVTEAVAFTKTQQTIVEEGLNGLTATIAQVSKIQHDLRHLSGSIVARERRFFWIETGLTAALLTTAIVIAILRLGATYSEKMPVWLILAIRS